MIQQTKEKHSTMEILTALYEMFQTAGDMSNADKMKQLLLKSKQEEFVIAFCGHFSAGKSSMINFFLQDQILPSSPIPTSANMVKVQKGEDFAKVFYHNAPPVIFPAPYDFKEVKKFAKDGDSVLAITISSSEFPLPDACVIMDTPGIDSTDDAHRVSTESALHLADVVFYVMDYNHVQSEVNFLFTKELVEADKPTYLIINMIDKHDEKELSFESFKKSVTEAFANWNVYPEGIFYTSVRDLENKENQIDVVRQFIYDMAENGEPSGTDTIMQSAKVLVDKHLTWLEEQFEEEHATDFALLAALPDEEREEMTKHVISLQQEKETISASIVHIKEQYSDDLEEILKSAYLMPATTRDLGKAYLESMQPDFKIGMLFSKKKTEAEKADRLQAFLEDIQEKAKIQLEWHVKEMAVKVLADSEVHDANLENAAQALKMVITEDFLRGSLKPQASLTGEYVLNYTNDLANALKKEARDVANQFLADLLSVMTKKVEQKLNQLSKGLESYTEFEQALRTVEELKAKVETEQKALEDIVNLTSEVLDQINVDSLINKWMEEEKNVKVQIMDMSGSNPLHSSNQSIMAIEEASVSAEVRSKKDDIRGKEKLLETAGALQEAAALIQPLKGFHSLYKELTEKANRLEQQTFTVALFGAFSAGKSSFANALMGESVLPVSPNPTTAAINKIMASNEEHAHGTATVTLKSEKMLLEDVSLALAAFGKKAATLDEAYQFAGEIVAKADEQETGKTHLSFLRAFYHGLSPYKNQLGTVLTVDLDGFKSFAAEESKSCLVDLIELYYDCAMTKQGMVLVDTPGADSINARHTGAAFEYIKNSDAILFVTYYNHPFSKADREFLIQLGRVKDSFAMDKMFFVVNAVDLAQNSDELDEVMEYVTLQLNGFGIRFPKLFPLTSKGALAEKLNPGSFKHTFLPNSGLANFQLRFDDFIQYDLTELAIESAEAAVIRAEELLIDVIDTSKQDEQAKQRALITLNEEFESIANILAFIPSDAERQRLKKEIEELTFYSKQRVFLRFSDFFKESFNPAVIKDDGQDLKQVLKKSLRNLLDSLGFDLAQEMRATALRSEVFVNKLLKEKQISLLQQIQEVRKSISLPLNEASKREILEFIRAFEDLTDIEFKKELALFKNPKSFFEKNEKVMMQDALQAHLDQPALDYVQLQGERLFADYTAMLEEELNIIQHNYQTETADILDGLRSALEEKVDIPYYEEVLAKMKNKHA